MPTIRQHRKKARHNESFADSFDATATPYTDWITTALFYGALHHVQALLHDLGWPDGQTDKHPKVEKLLSIDSTLRNESDLRDDYKQLRDDSEEARYFTRTFSAAEVTRLRQDEFARLKQRVDELLT